MRRIAIIEDQIHFQEYTKQILEQDDQLLLIFFNSAEEFIQNGINDLYDLIYLDIKLKEMNGLDLLRYTSTRYFDFKFVILTTIFSDNVVFDALENGAIGYLLKSEVSNLLDITHIFLNGGSVITPTIAFHVQRKFKKNPIEGVEKLTDRERQILDELVKGFTAENVALHFGLSPHTVRTQIRSIYTKLKVNNRTMLINKLNKS
jgi:DNA-binding NarL/FixJ family response regulator